MFFRDWEKTVNANYNFCVIFIIIIIQFRPESCAFIVCFSSIQLKFCDVEDLVVLLLGMCVRPMTANSITT